MADYPPEVVTAAATALADALKDPGPCPWHEEKAAAVLEAIAPALGDAVASKILAHMEAHIPPDAARAGICRRLFGIAARVAAGAFLAEDDMKRQAAEALARGDYIACVIPEDPAAP